MQIQISTDCSIERRERLTNYVGGVVEEALSPFCERLTRVELHLSDGNGCRGKPADKRCLVVARIRGRPPIVVTHQSAVMSEAVSGTINKLQRSIKRALERLRGWR